ILGTTLGGLNAAAAKSTRLWVQEMGGREESTIIGTGIKVPSPAAAFANSVTASVLDYDDGHWAAYHPASVVIPGAIAVAEREGATGKLFLEAVVAGYEVTIRAGAIMRSAPRASLSPVVQHSTGTAGAYGMAAASAKLMGLREEGIASALGVAEAHAPLAYAWPIPSYGHVPKESIGWAAMVGVSASHLARRGWLGACTIFDDPGVDKTLLDTLGNTYETLNTYFKPYAACRYTHSAIDALLEILRRHTLTSEDVTGVTVETHVRGSELNSPRPKNEEQAQYSFPFALGAALSEGKVGPEQMSARRLSDPVILKEASKIKLKVSPVVQRLIPQKYGCIVHVQSKDGKTYKLRKDIPKGDAENPMSTEELEAKFLSLASKKLGKRGAKEVLKLVQRLESLPGVDELVSCCSK
ncbi:MAG: MmgE/PrpD family protein, partial [Chloroflexi bacterium]|nr:MmgE/PrpD family protein [Chloroflexota bacterium]